MIFHPTTTTATNIDYLFSRLFAFAIAFESLGIMLVRRIVGVLIIERKRKECKLPFNIIWKLFWPSYEKFFLRLRKMFFGSFCKKKGEKRK